MFEYHRINQHLVNCGKPRLNKIVLLCTSYRRLTTRYMSSSRTDCLCFILQATFANRLCLIRCWWGRPTFHFL